MLTALKSFLDDFICSNFDIALEDAVDSHAFAAEFKVEKFQKKCVKFMREHMRDIRDMPEYGGLSAAAKQLLDDIMYGK
jgi:hypothetical protein